MIIITSEPNNKNIPVRTTKKTRNTPFMTMNQRDTELITRMKEFRLHELFKSTSSPTTFDKSYATNR
jgi:hypothetical protein